jgi:two-component system, NtrC family, sensor histidine kinase HydH
VKEGSIQVKRIADQHFQALCDANYRRTSRLFAPLMIGQFFFGLFLAVTISPRAWAGATASVHVHVWVALALGGLVSGLPLILIKTQPTEPVTRQVVAVAQMLWSAILIHLTGGRIETHFHVFGSLAFLAFYRDWKILVPATLVVAADHLLRQLLWPVSVYGIVNPEWWRFLEHAFWVVFEDVVLVMYCSVGVREMREISRSRAEVEVSHEAVVRSEKLAAVGQLSASVGHELRNPLAAVRNAAVYVGKRVREAQLPDPRVPQMLGIMERELGACGRIISDLLDYARERPPAPTPCPLRPLVEEAIALVPHADGTELVNEVPECFPIPQLDKDQFRQVIVNLVQNASEAMPRDRKPRGRVVVTATHLDRSIRLSIVDDGPGMTHETIERIFEPLFTTKTKGTGLGLAIVQSVISRHGARISVDSELGRGTTFHLDLRTDAARVAS